MKTRTKILSSFILFLLLCSLSFVASDSNIVKAQYNTPTPDENGRIIYEVQEGEFCSTIQERTGVSIEEIIRLNGLTDACTIFAGDKLVIGQVEVTAMPPTATATTPADQVTPTLTPMPGLAEICIVLFHMDGNGMLQAKTISMARSVLILDRCCFAHRYNGCRRPRPGDAFLFGFAVRKLQHFNCIERFQPDNRNQLSLDVQAGEAATIDFGAQLAEQRAPIPQPILSAAFRFWGLLA